MKKVYYLLVWDHKHGHDYGLFTSVERARTEGIKTMRETLDEWNEEHSEYTDEELWLAWPDISGGTEYFSIEEISLED